MGLQPEAVNTEKTNIWIIIPNYNGRAYLSGCLRSLARQTRGDFTALVVDNGSEDGSAQEAEKAFPDVRFLYLGENTGFTGAVNAGIQMAEGSKYVILLNNDTVAGRHFVEELARAMEADPNLFSAQAKMRRMDRPELLDDAGDFYCALGWGFARGKMKPASRYTRQDRVFYACGGAAVYRTAMLKEYGGFPDDFFAYLEDADAGWFAKLRGYENAYVPSAQVLHAGSAASGARWNAFKIRHSSRNSIVLVHRNMPLWQIAMNLPFLLAGFSIKAAFFAKMGFGKLYLSGLFEGLRACSPDNSFRALRRNPEADKNALRIEGELLLGIARRLIFFLP